VADEHVPSPQEQREGQNRDSCLYAECHAGKPTVRLKQLCHGVSADLAASKDLPIDRDARIVGGISRLTSNLAHPPFT